MNGTEETDEKLLAYADKAFSALEGTLQGRPFLIHHLTE